MQASDSTIGTVGRQRMAGNDPLLRDMPEIQATAIMRSMELLNEPVDGFPGLTWFRPGHRSLLHRNLRVWSHSSRNSVLLMEPLPTSFSHLGWSEIAIGEDPDGLAIYYRAWITISISENKMERCAASSCGDSVHGLSLGGLPLEL